MKKLINWWYWLTMKDFNAKLKAAKVTYKMVIASTNGQVSHFYNENGDQVRGYFTPTKKFHHVHPLLEKYL